MAQIDGRFLSVDTQIEKLENLLASSEVQTEELQKASDELLQISEFLSESSLERNHHWQDQKERVTALSGRIREVAIDSEIQNIKEEISAQGLRSRIQTLVRDHTLSPSQRNDLREHFRTKTQDVVVTRPFVSIGLEEHDVSISLFEMAEKLYEGQIKEFFTLYNQLPCETKQQLTPFLEEMGTDLSQIQDEQAFTQSINVIRALIGLAHEITKSAVLDRIPSEEDVKQIFDDLRVIKEQMNE